MGRPPIGERAMTATERQRRRFQKLKSASADARMKHESATRAWEEAENFVNELQTTKARLAKNLPPLLKQLHQEGKKNAAVARLAELIEWELFNADLIAVDRAHAKKLGWPV